MLNKEKILGLVRHTLTFVGAIYIMQKKKVKKQ